MSGFDVARTGGVATLTIDRPRKLNALTTAMWQAIPGILDELATAADIDVLVIRGSGGNFSAGSDIYDLPDDLQTFWKINSAADAAIAGFPLPTIAAIEGVCVGGGSEIAVACDLRVATPSARFGITASKLGVLYPSGPTERLKELVGPGAARRILLTGEQLDAETAQQLGLVDYLCDDVSAKVTELAGTLQDRSSLSLFFTKQALLGNHLEADEALSGAAADELREGKAAFAEKRAPRFPAHGVLQRPGWHRRAR
ncbi:enoyl-CoA hydratase/isomerase family protein [Saxibacter everestensis]|uniref:Enoyl-CoA hydratase/isomerase family protein n=1 Tax=Saxibacter everestensis TaxID=2909229 RepID=A0ABY8QPT3_9MICO|nr:enoyl-CoA hydratase/isomerase family protein [Brevibacteriaceae bacterium ZFBP1038]